MSAAVDELALPEDFGLRSRVMKLLARPEAEIFPMMSPAELKKLSEDIEENGQDEPIVIHPDDEKILDGRNRYEAILMIQGRIPKFVLWTGEVGKEIAFVKSKNLERRHLNETQRAMAGAKIIELRAPEAKKRQGQRTDLRANLPESEFGNTADKIGEELNVSGRSIKSASQVLRDGPTELVDMVSRGEVAVSAASEVSKLVANLPPEEQKKVLGNFDPAVIKQVAKEQRNKRTIEALTSSETNEHFSPEDISRRARALFGGVIDLDPASCVKANEIVQAKRIFTIDDNGLDHDWHGNVFLNPPGGRRDEDNESNMSLWTGHLRDQFKAGNTSAALLVIFRLDVSCKWFHPFWDFAICYPWDRMDFLDENLQPEKSPTHSNALVYLGHDLDGFVELFSPVGKCVIPGPKYAVSVREKCVCVPTVSRHFPHCPRSEGR